MDFKLALLSLSTHEKGRIPEPKCDPSNLGPFSEIEALITHSLRPPKLLQVQSQEGHPLREPRVIDRPFEDETLLRRLIQYKNQIPLSNRIIRNTES